MPDPNNIKEHYKSFIKNKNKKSVTRSKIIAQQAKNPKIQILWHQISY